MPKLQIPNEAGIRTIRNFLFKNAPFSDTDHPAQLIMHPKYSFMEPVVLAMAAAWGGWCQRNGCPVVTQNVAGPHTNYAIRMGLLKHLGVAEPIVAEHEESGRFIPITQVRSGAELQGVIGNVSALLHLDRNPNALAAVQYCISELLRNVIEHAGAQEGAFVCAQRYPNRPNTPERVSIAVADCGAGITATLSDAYPEAANNDKVGLQLAMQLGVTGARKIGMYAATENAGAGLFFTRAIAKATSGYFALISGNGAFRLQRRGKDERPLIYPDAFDDPRHDFWTLDWSWPGTVAAVEIFTEQVGNFPTFFKTIVEQLPAKKTVSGKIKFT